MNRLILILVVGYSFLGMGCKSELKNPHEIDPIYKSINEKFKQSEASIATAKKTVEDAVVAFSKTEPQTYQRVVAKRDLEAAKRKLDSLQQENDYLRIRLKHRELEDRITYKIAFQADQPWPNPKEYEAYLVHERLSTASKKWDDRVPKLDDRIKAAWPKLDPTAEKKAEQAQQASTEEGPASEE